ncbi:hypothetical protein TDCHD05_170009 [Tenacibaculum dicentrarchi]|nr:hypothetical protein TDCHD05_170009 [Tenacibaculum dicentrarchi]
MGGLLSGVGWKEALRAGVSGAITGGIIGAAAGTGAGFKQAKLENRNPWNDNLKLDKAIGAAPKGFSKNNFKSVKSNFLRQNGIEDIHTFKADALGTNKNLRLFDVVKHTQTGELLIIRKSTQEIIESTGIFF